MPRRSDEIVRSPIPLVTTGIRSLCHSPGGSPHMTDHRLDAKRVGLAAPAPGGSGRSRAGSAAGVASGAWCRRKTASTEHVGGPGGHRLFGPFAFGLVRAQFRGGVPGSRPRLEEGPERDSLRPAAGRGAARIGDRVAPGTLPRRRGGGPSATWSLPVRMAGTGHSVPVPGVRRARSPGWRGPPRLRSPERNGHSVSVGPGVATSAANGVSPVRPSARRRCSSRGRRRSGCWRTRCACRRARTWGRRRTSGCA